MELKYNINHTNKMETPTQPKDTPQNTEEFNEPQPVQPQTAIATPEQEVKSTRVGLFAVIFIAVVASNIPKIINFYRDHFGTFTAEDDESCRAKFEKLQRQTQSAVISSYKGSLSEAEKSLEKARELYSETHRTCRPSLLENLTEADTQTLSSFTFPCPELRDLLDIKGPPTDTASTSQKLAWWLCSKKEEETLTGITNAESQIHSRY